jgi:hypothetical protein
METQIIFTILPRKGGKNLLNKNTTFTNYLIFIVMGRPKKDTNDKKIKLSISLDRELYNKIKSDNFKPSRIIEKLVKEYYGN